MQHVSLILIAHFNGFIDAGGLKKVFVVKGDGTADLRVVVVGRTVGGETVIKDGVQPGEKVVTNGQLRLVPGAKVSVQADRKTL